MPIDPTIPSYASNFSKAYIRHLITAGESLAGTLLSIHNISFFLTLMSEARAHIEAGDYLKWSGEFIERYNAQA